MSRLPQYLAYHRESLHMKDIDPSYDMLRYICNRYELNTEQRYWLAFVYAMTYCGASTFYVYNEFPDYENLDSGRLNRWWTERGRAEIICQTDRRWVRSSSLFVPAVESYRRLLGNSTQHSFFSARVAGLATPEERYNRVYQTVSSLYSFGQFSLFLYLEALHTITPMDFAPTDLDLDKAWSCRNGLCYAYGLDSLITEKEMGMPNRDGERTAILNAWGELKDTLLNRPMSYASWETANDTMVTTGTRATNIWQIETTLCAYRKFHAGKRYLGYYIDRQALEIAKMERNAPSGVAWDVLWQFRNESYAREHLVEQVAPSLQLANKGLPSKWVDARKFMTSRTVGEAR